MQTVLNAATLGGAAISAVGLAPAVIAYHLRHRIADNLLPTRPGSVAVGHLLERRGGPSRRPPRRRDIRRQGALMRYLEHTRARLFGETVRLDLIDRMTHWQIVAPTNQAKTTQMHAMAVQDLVEGLGLFVLETGGDLAKKLIPYAEALDRPIFVFDPGDEDAWKWNPIDGDPEKVAERAAATLEMVGSSSEDFFKVHNATVLRACVLAAHAWAAKTGGIPTLYTVRRIITDTQFRREALDVEGMEPSGWAKGQTGEGAPTVNNPHLTEEARHFWQDRYYRSMGERDRKEFTSGMVSALDMILGRSTVKAAVCPDGSEGEKVFPLDHALECGGLIVMRMHLGKTGVKTARALSVWIMQAFQQVVLDRDPESAYPVIAYFDEVHNTLGRNMQNAAEDFSHWIAVARHYNVGCVFGYQGYEMIPYELKVVLDGNARNKLVSGGLPAKDAEEAQKTFGDDADQVKNTRKTSEGIALHPKSISVSTSEEDHYRFSVDEIRSVPRGCWIFSATVRGILQYPVLILSRPAPSVEAVRAKVRKRRAGSRHAKQARPDAPAPDASKEKP